MTLSIIIIAIAVALIALVLWMGSTLIKGGRK